MVSVYGSLARARWRAKRLEISRHVGKTLRTCFGDSFAREVFIAALLAEVCVLAIHYLNAKEIAPEWLTMGYLGYNVVGCGLVVGFSTLLQGMVFGRKPLIH
jgi:hypothetical protein